MYPTQEILRQLATIEGEQRPHAVQASAGGVSYLEIDSSVIYTGPQPGAILRMISEASQDTYTPSAVANWSSVAPTSVANALDRIAAHLGPIP
jgi:hypothetical protein